MHLANLSLLVLILCTPIKHVLTAPLNSEAINNLSTLQSVLKVDEKLIKAKFSTSEETALEKTSFTHGANCYENRQQQSAPSPHTPITITLKITKAPRLYESVTVTCTVRTASDAPATTAKIELPQGATKIRGKLNWTGNLKRGIPVVFQAKIKFVVEGNWMIKATATHQIDEQNSWGDIGIIYLNITKKVGRFGFAVPSPRNKTESNQTPQ